MCRPPAHLTSVRAVHLARRFLGSLRPGGPSRVDQQWAEAQLLPVEAALWRDLPSADRRHSAAVARRVEGMLGPDATRPVLAAALLHDVGKKVSGLGTPGRVVATLAALTVVRRPADAERWSRSTGVRWFIGTYLRHPEIGAALLDAAGSDPVTVAWTLEHHRPPERCTLEARVADALRRADDD